MTADWQPSVDEQGHEMDEPLNQSLIRIAYMGAWQHLFLPFTESERCRDPWGKLKAVEDLASLSSFSLSTPSSISLPSLTSCFSLWPSIHLSFSLLLYSLPFPLSSSGSSQCKGILPWETVGPLTVDSWPGFHNDAKQATRTSQCDVMAGCPLKTSARTKQDCQCCPWCMHIQ